MAWELGRVGFVETVRGNGGRLRLARPATEISAGAVARYMERTIPLAECFPRRCRPMSERARLPIPGVLAEAEAALFAVLHRYTVHDLVDRNWELRAVLFADPP